MKNLNKNVTFTEDMIEALEQSFNEDNERIARLSSPLSNLNLEFDEGDSSEN